MSNEITGRTPIGRRFTTLWAGQTASLLGSHVSGVGVSIAAFVDTGSVWWLSILYLASQLPGLLLASYAGEFVDRSDRRRVLIGADAVAGLATSAAIVLLLTGHLELWHLAIVSVAGSAVSAFQTPAYAAALPLLVPRDAIDRAQGMLQIGPSIGLLAGPAIAGVLIGLGGIGAVLAFDVVTFLVAVATTAMTPIPLPPTPEDAGADHDRVELRGLRATWRSLTGRQRGLRHLLVFAGALNVVMTIVNVLLFALLLPVVGETGAGLMLSLGGVAMLGTATAVSRLGVPEHRVRALVAGTVLIGVGAVAAGLRPAAPLLAVGLMAMLSGATLLNAASGTLFQTEVPADRQGRLMSLRRVAAQSLAPVAVLGIAPLTEQLVEPAMQPGGVFAATIGAVIGTGEGRGIGLLFIVVGVAVVTIGASMLRSRALAVLDVADAGGIPPAPGGASKGEATSGTPRDATLLGGSPVLAAEG